MVQHEAAGRRRFQKAGDKIACPTEQQSRNQNRRGAGRAEAAPEHLLVIRPMVRPGRASDD